MQSQKSRERGFYMVNNEHLIQQIQGLAVRNRLVFISNLFLKRLFLVLTQYTLKLLAELDVIFTQILVQILCSEHAVNLFKLVKIIIALEKWVSVEQLRWGRGMACRDNN